ncbi:uncharacterized protein BJ212DRAFT_1483427 [Suillus subaureus]|uniref:Uncharacterized protein n=1 Tax=Suillus subaureus TaxID=48587 RepID=A0A9P7E605_9AGAM|nr:uncharacterized protein BJ212DRAFT_1483427 [Suillus subaureus]KAG1812251.1 hypothetical protein BJ212DRAFT_1483427 [Suillus subaureus]
MNIDNDKPCITNIGEMDIVGITDQDMMNINENEPQITDKGGMNVVGLNDEDVMNIIDEHEHNQMEDMHIISLNDNLDTMNVYEDEYEQIVMRDIIVVSLDNNNHMHIDEDGLDVVFWK